MLRQIVCVKLLLYIEKPQKAESCGVIIKNLTTAIRPLGFFGTRKAQIHADAPTRMFTGLTQLA